MRNAWWSPILPLLAATASWAVTPIADLVRNPDAYANTTVTVEGTVTSRVIAYRSDAAYTLQGSDDFRITIFGRGPAPTPGAHLVVTGTVGRKPPDEEFDFPPAILETTRETK
jgi:hypothetical protein